MSSQEKIENHLQTRFRKGLEILNKANNFKDQSVSPDERVRLNDYGNAVISETALSAKELGIKLTRE